MTRIAIDAMGGDWAPDEIVYGGLWAAMDYNVGIEFVGKEEKIKEVIKRVSESGFIYDGSGVYKPRRIKPNVSKLDILITNAEEVIEMGEAPGQAIRKKRDSSIVKSVAAVAKGSSDAVVAAGSTGAAMAASLFGLGRLPGIDRPAIAATLPTMKEPVVLIDAGANTNSTPEMLTQFGVMGMTFSKNVLGVENPTVGILNIGEEAGKGDNLAQSAYKLFDENKEKYNFIGNIEGKEIFLGNCNVIVCDGFVGNVGLKTIEGASSMLFHLIRQEFKKDLISKIIGAIAKPAMKRIFERINYEEFGGALLLGVKGITVISHGRSKAYAIKNAVRVAKNAVESGLNKKIAEFYEG